MSHDDMDFEMNREFTELAQALREHRPAPEPEFTDRLDQAVADHFPPEWASETALGEEGRGGIGTFTERLRRRMGGRALMLPAVAGVASVLMLATVVAIGIDNGRFGSGNSDESGVARTMSGGGTVEQLSDEGSAAPAEPSSAHLRQARISLRAIATPSCA